MIPSFALPYQRGQALVFSLITVSIIILVMVSMYTIGQQSIAKVKLQNTADAAAYSAVQAEARDYNFSAYTNRAIIANQVAVAQVVGLTSWSRAYHDTYNGSTKSIPKILTSLGGPLAKILWDVPWKASAIVSNTFKTAFDTVGPASVWLLDKLIDVLSLSQTIYHYGTALTVAQTIGLSPAQVLDKLADVNETSLGPVKDLLKFNDAYDVIKLNDVNAELSTPGTIAAIAHLAQWFTFTQKKDPNTPNSEGKYDDRMAQVTVDSLDKFSRNRSTKDGGPKKNFPEMMYLTPFVVDPTRFIPYQNGALLMYLWHRGGTELKHINNTKKTWSAMDATGFFGAAIFWISILGIPIPIPIVLPFIPMGSGAAQAGSSSDLIAGNNFGTASSNAYGGVYKNVNTAPSALIRRAKGAGQTMDEAAGLRPYFDVKKVGEKDFNLTGPSLILEIQKADNSIPTSNAILVQETKETENKIPTSEDKSGSRFSLNNGTRSGFMRSLTKAEVYFSRPRQLWARSDSKTEYGSLYSPYWQARLAPNKFAEQWASLSFHLW